MNEIDFILWIAITNLFTNALSAFAVGWVIYRQGKKNADNMLKMGIGQAKKELRKFVSDAFNGHLGPKKKQALNKARAEFEKMMANNPPGMTSLVMDTTLEGWMQGLADHLAPDSYSEKKKKMMAKAGMQYVKGRLKGNGQPQVSGPGSSRGGTNSEVVAVRPPL
jgi:hypothetical protein